MTEKKRDSAESPITLSLLNRLRHDIVQILDRAAFVDEGATTTRIVGFPEDLGGKYAIQREVRYRITYAIDAESADDDQEATDERTE